MSTKCFEFSEVERVEQIYYFSVYLFMTSFVNPRRTYDEWTFVCVWCMVDYTSIQNDFYTIHGTTIKMLGVYACYVWKRNYNERAFATLDQSGLPIWRL